MSEKASPDGHGVWVGKWAVMVDRELAVAENPETGKRYTSTVTKIGGVYSPGGVWSDGVSSVIEEVPQAVKQKARALARQLK